MFSVRLSSVTSEQANASFPGSTVAHASVVNMVSFELDGPVVLRTVAIPEAFQRAAMLCGGEPASY
jgi:hypothetical protein